LNSLPCITVFLTGVSAADDVNSFELGPVDFSHITISLYVGPVPGQDLVAVWIVLNLPLAFMPCCLETEIESAYARKHAAKSHLSTFLADSSNSQDGGFSKWS